MVLVLAVIGWGCEGEAPAARQARRPTVASLVPAATDILVGMGAGDHLVGVSSHDVERPGTAGLPRVGDYQEFDWEKLAALKPDVMVVFMSPERMPPALRERAAELKIRLLNVQIERLEDVFAQLTKLGEVVGEQEKAAAAAEKLKAELGAVAERIGDRRRVKVLLAREPGGDGGVGRGNFLDDVLSVAGGQNVVQGAGWPMIDREQVAGMRPEVILHLLPGAKEHVVAEARRSWAAMKDVPAVSAGRVYILTEWYVLQPGTQLGRTAERFAELIHGQVRP
jgi:iron complex transport system substrate-binding protein